MKSEERGVSFAFGVLMATDLSLLQKPSGTVAFDDGTVVLVDLVQHCLRVMNEDGSERCKIGSRGSRFEQFLRPYGICKVGRDLVCVCDRGNRRLSFVDINRQAVVKAFGGLSYPADVTFISSRHLLAVADAKKKSLDFYDLEGELQQSVKIDLVSLRVRIHPHPVSGNLHVVDSGGKETIVFEVSIEVR